MESIHRLPVDKVVIMSQLHNFYSIFSNETAVSYSEITVGCAIAISIISFVVYNILFLSSFGRR